MSESDQVAFFESAGNRTALLLSQHNEEMQRISRKIDLLINRADQFEAVTKSLIKAVEASLDDGPLQIVSATQPELSSDPLSATITIPLVQAFHRLTGDLPPQFMGRLRTFQVWIGGEVDPDRAHLQPPSWDKVPDLLAALLTEWNESFPRVVAAGEDERLEALAKFHQRFLSIHPFPDGNGRTARALLEQQSADLFGGGDLSLLERGGRYVEALLAADGGDHKELASLIGEMLAGSVSGMSQPHAK